MGAQEKAGAGGLDDLHKAPVGHVDDADLALVQMRHRHQAMPAPHPAYAGPQMRHAGQRQARDLTPHVEVDDDAGFPRAVGADQVVIAGIEEEIVKGRGDVDPAAREQALFGHQRFLHPRLVAVDEAVVIGASIRVGRDLPYLRHVLQREDEGVAVGRLIDGGDAAGRALAALHLHHLGDGQVIRRQDRQRFRQVAGDGQPFAIRAHRDVAAVQSGADAADLMQGPDVVFLHPAIAGHDEHIAPVGGEFRPAMDGEGGFEPVQHRERVTVEDRDMAVPGFHHQRDVHRVAGEDWRGGGDIVRVHRSACRDLFRRPDRRRGQRSRDIGRDRRDFVGRERRLEGGHLRHGAAIGDDGLQPVALQPAKAFGDQRRTRAAEPRLGMARGALIGVDHRPVRRGKGGGGEQAKGNDEPDHGFSHGRA